MKYLLLPALLLSTAFADIPTCQQNCSDVYERIDGTIFVMQTCFCEVTHKHNPIYARSNA